MSTKGEERKGKVNEDKNCYYLEEGEGEEQGKVEEKLTRNTLFIEDI